MTAVETIFHAVEFIENNLKNPICVADMADSVSYSIYHFCRTFNRIVHHTPYDFLIRRRLSESSRDLLETRNKVIDIGLDYQFNSPEIFSRAFKSMFGMPPNEWRKQGQADPRLLLSRRSLAHLQHIHSELHLPPATQNLPAFQLVGLINWIAPEPEETARVWRMLSQSLEAVRSTSTHSRLNSGDNRQVVSANDCRKSRGDPFEIGGANRTFWGVTWYPPEWDGRRILYMAGMEADDCYVADSPLASKRIPPLECARFSECGSWQNQCLTRDYIYQTWLPKAEIYLPHSFELECFDGFPLISPNDRVRRSVIIPIGAQDSSTRAH